MSSSYTHLVIAKTDILYSHQQYVFTECICLDPYLLQYPRSCLLHILRQLLSFLLSCQELQRRCHLTSFPKWCVVFWPLYSLLIHLHFELFPQFHLLHHQQIPVQYLSVFKKLHVLFYESVLGFGQYIYKIIC